MKPRASGYAGAVSPARDSRSRTLATGRLVGALFLLVAGSMIGCGGVADGGPIGSAITASLVGNVIDVAEPLASASGRADEPTVDLPPIRVSIDGRPEAVTQTDANGAFELTGDVAGNVTLRFETDGLNVATQLSVPADSIVSLRDIELSAAGVEVQSARQLDFVGTVRAADCAGGTLLVDDLANNPFEIALVEETIFSTEDGASVSCSAAAPGTRIAIDGIVMPGELGRVVALRIVVDPVPNTPLEGPRSLVVFGFAVAVSCNADGVTGRIDVQESFGRTRLRIAHDTSITRPDRTAIRCADVRLGDQVAGIGTLTPESRGEIRADRLIVSRRPRPAVRLRFVGYLTSLDCTTGALELFYRGTLTDFLLLPETVVTPALTCEELGLGDKLKGSGRLASDGSDVIEMLRVRVEPRS